jgi:ABC-type oligopeptide transport system ATPase subunit
MGKRKKKDSTKRKNPPKGQSAGDVSKKIAKRGAKQTRRTMRRFGGLMGDTVRSMLGVGQRRVNRRSNRTISGRYLNDFITIAETTHLAGLHVDLSQILIEPRFLPAPEIEQPVAEDDVRQEVFYVIPRIPDLPFITAPYNLESYRIEQLAAGHRKIAILGNSGSGKTTALLAIALWLMGEIHFEEKEDPVKAKLAEEEAALSDKERAELERKRREMRDEAKRQLEEAIESGEAEQVGEVAVTQAEKAAQQDAEFEETLPEFNTLFPIYIHCADMNVDSSSYGSDVDPAEPLIRALQRRVSTLTARTIPRTIYQRLEEKRALILMDGYDDLPPAERRRFESWLHAFDKFYGGNFLILSGPATGYGKLTKLGITPLFIKPWNEEEIGDFVDKWAEVWPQVTATKHRPGVAPSDNQVKRAKVNTTALTPAELTLKVWGSFEDDDTRLTLESWILPYINRYLPTKITYADALPLLQLAAALQIDLGFVTRKSVETILREQDASGKATLSSASLEDLDRDGDGVADFDDTNEDDDGDEAEAERRRLINELVFSGVLVRYQGRRLRFRHQIIADYLASLTLKPLPEDDPVTLYDLAQKPNWARPLRIAVLHTDLSNVVKMKLAATPDMLQSSLIELSQWLAMVHDKPTWHDDILQAIGTAFAHPTQYVTNRERIAAALVQMRDPNSAAGIFESVLNSGDGDLRRLAAIGIGALGAVGKRYVEPLADLAADPEEDVRIAAIHALAAIGDTIALQTMAEVLLDGDERAQQAVAEEFAGMRQSGYPTLYDAVQHPEMAVRRAALFGVRRIETEWASELIRQTWIAEEEWFARIVALEAFIKEQSGPYGPTPPITPDQIEWVQAWAEQNNIPLPAGQQSTRALQQSLMDPNVFYRVYGAIALGQFGVIQATQALYERLTDPEPAVQEAAHKGLVELQLAVGEEMLDPR